MRKFLLILVLEFTNVSFLSAQNADSIVSNDGYGFKLISEYFSGHNSIDFHTGCVFNEFNELNNSFESVYGRQIDDRITSFGASIKGGLWMDAYLLLDANLSVEYYLPAEYDFSDSLKFTLSGYRIGSVWSKDILYKSEHLDFLVGIGFSFARISLIRNDNSYFAQSGKYTNPFFCPKVVIEPRFLFGPLSIAFRGEYLSDISNYSWRLKSTSLPEIGVAASSGFSGLVILGFRLFK